MSEYESPEQTVADYCITEHRDLLGALTNESRWSKEADLGVGNQVVASTHENRTVLELIQNARDAIRDRPDSDGRVAVIVGPDSLLIANTGRPFELHDDEVFEAVTGLGRSEKLKNRNSIGEKGVGLKSLLQLSERFSVHSVVDDQRVATQFSRYHAGQMLLEAYRHYLQTPTLREELDLAAPVIDSYQSVFDAIVGEQPQSMLPSELETDTIVKTETTPGQAPPTPADVLTDLPRLSLFRYPFPTTEIPGESDETSRLVDALLDQNSSESSTATEATGWLSEHAGDYQTVVRLDYEDQKWAELLESVREELSAANVDVVEAFDNNRRSASVGGLSEDETPQEQFWEECTELSASTLVLLGELEEIDFLKLDIDEGTSGLEISARREVTIETPADQQTTVSHDPELSRIPHGITETTFTPTGATTHDREFLRYSQTLTPDVHEWLEDEDRDIDDESAEMDVLLERPRPSADDWEPTPEPLHLYYPISEAPTPFPFVIHAPFEVSFDRQHLANDSKNQALLGELSDLIATVSEDLVTQGKDTSDSPLDGYRTWMPWLVAPVDVVDTATGGHLAEGINETLSQLHKTSIVPTDHDSPLQPTETLLDPTRLNAFEALRGRDADPSIPAGEVITHGGEWKDALSDPTNSEQSRFREFLSQIGLTSIIETIASDAPGADLVTVLCDFWERASKATHSGEYEEWHISVAEPDHTRQYFEAIANALAEHSPEEDDNSEDEITAAARLGRHGVPLLPAEMHQGGTTNADSDEVQVTRLVRAWPSEGQSDAGQRQRSERIVFRRQEPDSSQQSVQELPTPPKQLPVYIIPYKSEWVGPLKRHNRRWGTRELEGQAAFYRRVGAEAGGFSGEENGDADVVGYLTELYKQSTTGQTAEWVTPQPFHNKRFEDVEDVFAYDTINGTPSDYDAFLERRYLQTIPLPAADGGSQPAERLVFGPEWADRFRAVAKDLEAEDGAQYPFSGTDDDIDTEPATQFRRWAAAIDCRCDFETANTPTLASPSDDRWADIRDRMGLSGVLRDRWELYFLLHLGVQVGPHINWGWLFPGHGTDTRRGTGDRRTGALSLAEVRTLADADPDLESDAPISPSQQLLDRYQTVCWRSENHPAFSAGHSGSCREDWLDCKIDEWVNNDDLAIPTWWHLTELDPEAGSKHREAIRDATALIWPELSAAIADTAWYCDGTYYSHQVNSHDSTIPALGIVQLQEAELWPIKEYESESSNSDAPGGLSTDKLHKASILVTTEGQPGAARFLPRLNLDKITAAIDTRLPSHNDTASVDLTSLPTKLGAKTLDELTSAEAAERLSAFLEHRTVGDMGRTRSHEALSAMESTWDSQSNTEPTYGLLRRLTATTHVSRKLTDDEPKRQWLRRDLWHTGVRLPIRWADESLVLYIHKDVAQFDGADLRIYTQQIPQHARERFAGDQDIATVERPAREARSIAYLLGGDPDATTPPFGIRTVTEQPDLEVASGEFQATGQERDALDDLQSKLVERIDYLLAAYDADASEPNHRGVYDRLTAVANNQIGIIENSAETSSRRSTQWSPPNTADDDPNQIAIYRNAVGEHSEDSAEIPAYLAADGLAQVIDQYSLRDVFENILIKTTNALDYDYADQVQDMRAELSELQEKRFELVQQALRTLLANVDKTIDPPEFDLENDHDVEATLTAMADAATSSGDSVVNNWVDTFRSAGVSRKCAQYCVAAAATEEMYDRHRYVAVALQDVSKLQRDDFSANPIWDELESWPSTQDVDTLRRYLTAVTKVDVFWRTYADSESGEENAIALAADAAANAAASSTPLTPVIETIPDGDRLPTTLSSRLLIELPGEIGEPIPEPIPTIVIEWHTQRQETLSASAKGNSDIYELVESFTTALGNTTDALAIVEKALDDYRDRPDGRGSSASQLKRRELTMQWVSAKDSELDDAVTSAVRIEDAPDDGGAPSIDSGANKTSRSNAEIADDRGREAELMCLARAWDQFRVQEQTTRERILDELRHWRSNEKWRMQPVNAIANLETGDSSTVGNRPEKVLRRMSLSDDQAHRAAFRLLFDTSGERGPGFDYIDPFAGMGDGEDWLPKHMRRVEVKAVTPERATSGRVKLTGNEFRMARRRGPNPTDSDLDGVSQEPTDRYLLRLVSLPREWRGSDGTADRITIREISDFIEYGGFDSDEEPLWEKLRGGSFYVSFGPGD